MRDPGFPAAVRASIVLALALAPAWSPARAATKHHAPDPKQPFAYNTTGVVNVQAAPGSVAGPSPLLFQGVTGATFTPGSGQPIQLGQFVVPSTAAANGQATTYANTPFEVQVRAPEFDKTSTVPVLDKVFPKLGHKLALKTVTEASLLIRGVLNGTVSPTGQANVTVTVNSLKPGGLEMQTQDHITHYAFPVRFGDLKLPPSWTMSAMSPITAPAAQALLPAAAPEPSTFALYGAILGGLALARRRRPR